MKRSFIYVMISLVLSVIFAIGAFADTENVEEEKATEEEVGMIFVKAINPEGEEVTGVEIYLDGDLQGETPLTIEDVSTGEHEIALKNPDFADWISITTVQAGEVTKLLADLVWRKGSLTIISSPPEARAFLDGIPQGVTPLILNDLDSKIYVLSLVKENRYYESEIKVEPGDKIRLEAVLDLEVPEEMVYVPGGEFTMGSDEGDNDESPQIMVYLDPFFIDQSEVTNAEYSEFINDGGYFKQEYWTEEGWKFIKENRIFSPKYWRNLLWNSPSDPVVGVSWYEADAYARWTGKRLPTEAEWEKAARGTDGKIWSWGNDFSPEKANTNAPNDAHNYTAQVNSYPLGISPYGCYDMAGNVAEWVADWYDAYYYYEASMFNPQGPKYGSYRGIRGGSWFTSPEEARCSARGYDFLGDRTKMVGFRCAKD